MREEFIRILIEVAEDRAKVGRWVPAELGIIHSASSIVGILAWWLRQTGTFPIKRIAEILDRLVITPLVGKREPLKRGRGRRRLPI